MTTERELVLPVLRLLEEEGGELQTATIRERIRKGLKLSPEDLAPLSGRNDQRIDQVIRNLKSHKKAQGNPFCDGYLKDVPRCFRLTESGRRYLRNAQN